MFTAIGGRCPNGDTLLGLRAPNGTRLTPEALLQPPPGSPAAPRFATAGFWARLAPAVTVNYYTRVLLGQAAHALPAAELGEAHGRLARLMLVQVGWALGSQPQGPGKCTARHGSCAAGGTCCVLCRGGADLSPGARPAARNLLPRPMLSRRHLLHFLPVVSACLLRCSSRCCCCWMTLTWRRTHSSGCGGGGGGAVGADRGGARAGGVRVRKAQRKRLCDGVVGVGCWMNGVEIDSRGDCTWLSTSMLLPAILALANARPLPYPCLCCAWRAPHPQPRPHPRGACVRYGMGWLAHGAHANRRDSAGGRAVGLPDDMDLFVQLNQPDMQVRGRRRGAGRGEREAQATRDRWGRRQDGAALGGNKRLVSPFPAGGAQFLLTPPEPRPRRTWGEAQDGVGGASAHGGGNGESKLTQPLAALRCMC